MSELILFHIAHRDCETCADCADRARTIATASGSVEATHSEGDHTATVRRSDYMGMV